MKLIDCVESLSTHTLQKILEHHPTHSIQSEEGSTLSFLLDIDYLKKEWEKMRVIEQYLLITFLGHVEGRFISYQKIASGLGLPVGEAIVALTLLRQKGIIFTHRRFFGEVAYFIPDDVREQLLRLFMVTDATDHMLPMQSTVQPSMFYEGLWRFLQYIRTEPLQLTQKGTIHKRQLSRLEAVIESSAIMEQLPIEYDGSSHYSKPLALYLDFAIEHDLIGESDDMLMICDERVTSWTNVTEEERMEYLWRYFRNKLSTFYPLEMRLVLDWLYLQEHGRWAQWEHLIAFLQKLRHNTDSMKDPTTVPIVQALHAFGMIVLRAENGQFWIGRPLFEDAHSSSVYVQSNLQLLLPIMTPIRIRWQIGEFADMIQHDTMLTYDITKQSIQRAVELGWNEETLLAFLQSIAPAIPENVRLMLHNWIEEYSKLRFMDVTLLECTDEQLFTEIMSQSMFEPYILGKLSSRHLIVKREKLQHFREALERAGYSPMKHTITYEENKQTTLHSASPILKVDLVTVPKIENVYPEWEDTFPGIRTIPKSWVNTYRTYHPSSLIDILKRAQQHHLRLSLRLNNETEVEKVSPIAIDQVGGDYWLKYIRNEYREDRKDEWISVKEIRELAVHLPF